MLPSFFLPLACGYLGLWILVALVCYKLVGRFKYKKYSHEGIAYKEHFYLQRNLSAHWPRPYSRKKQRWVETAGIAYSLLQFTLYALSANTPIWYEPESKNFSTLIICLRSLAFDVPMLGVIGIIVFGFMFSLGLQGATVLHFFAKKHKHNVKSTWREVYTMLSTVMSHKSYGPEIHNFFYCTFFFTLTRNMFKIISCAHTSFVKSPEFLVNQYVGDFSCWNSRISYAFLASIIGFTAVFFLFAIRWNAQRTRHFPAFPMSPRYLTLVTLLSFLLSFMSVSFNNQPTTFAALCASIFAILTIYTTITLPYYPAEPEYALHLNGAVIAGYFTAFYLSLATLFMITYPPATRVKVLYIVGIFPVFLVAYVIAMFYMVKFRASYFTEKSKNYLLELLRIIATKDTEKYSDGIVHSCCLYFVLSVINNPEMEDKANLAVRELHPVEYAAVFKWSMIRLPLLIWWHKWQVKYCVDKDLTLEMVQYKIQRKSNVPSLMDLASYAVLRSEIRWESVPELSHQMKQYLHELLACDMSVFSGKKWRFYVRDTTVKSTPEPVRCVAPHASPPIPVELDPHTEHTQEEKELKGRSGMFREKRGFRELLSVRSMEGMHGIYFGGDTLEGPENLAIAPPPSRPYGLHRVNVLTAQEEIDRTLYEDHTNKNSVFCDGYRGYTEKDLAIYGFGSYGYGHPGLEGNWMGMSAIARALQSVDSLENNDLCHLALTLQSSIPLSELERGWPDTRVFGGNKKGRAY